ncbi:MAG TPA: hypothetical protein VGF94_19465 [Kofleriaceae bacterium]|jgi:hypothetical protein
MKRVLAALVLAAVVLVAACSSDDSGSNGTTNVTCDGANIGSNVDSCTIDFGVCSDEQSYVLSCGITTGLLICNCEIENVFQQSQTVEIVNTCDATLTQLELQRAWLDCGVNMSLGSGS